MRALSAKVDVLLERGKDRGAADLPELVYTLRGYFGSGTFTASTILRAADEPEGAELFDVLTDLDIDLDGGHGAAVRLGVLLRKLDALEVVGEVRGVVVYKLK